MSRYLTIYMEKLIKRLPLLLSFLLGGILGGALVGVFAGDLFMSNNPVKFELHERGSKFTNPLLECEEPENIVGRKLRPFKHKVQELIEDKIDNKKATHISVYFRDLNNGPWFGINDDKDFSPASLLKVPIMMAYFKVAESNPQILSRQITYKGGTDYNSLENIRPSKVTEVGKSYSVEELIYNLIIYSDNNAKDILENNLDFMLFTQPFTDLGIGIPGIRKTEDFMDVKTYASFFRVLFNASYLGKAMSERALDYLSRVEFKDGLVAGVPKNIIVSHKFGERREHKGKDIKQLHDCGIIYYPNHPYLLCVMTRGDEFNILAENIKDISYLVYKEIDLRNGEK